MTRSRLQVLAGAVALIAAIPAVAADAAPPAVVLRAEGTAEGMLVLDRAAVLDPAQAALTGSGRIAGFAVFTTGAGGRVVLAELQVKRWDAPTGPLRISVTERGPVRLPAGRYRVVVFGDAPARIIAPLKSGSSANLVATRSTTARADVVDLLQGAPTVPAVSRATRRYAGGFLLAQTYFRARAHQAEAVAQCFAPASDEAQACINRAGYTGAVASPGSVGDGYTSQMAAVYGSDLPAGQDVDVLMQAVDVDAPTFAEWLIVSA